MSSKYLNESLRWSIGERAARAKARGPHGLSEYARRIGRNPATVRRWARVARAYPAGRRQMPGLSFSHFEVAAAEPDRLELLAAASGERWPVARLKAEIAARRPAGHAPGGVSVFTPAVLDQAIHYCDSLAAGARGSSRRLGPAVRDRVERLAALASSLAAPAVEEGGTRRWGPRQPSEHRARGGKRNEAQEIRH